MERRMLGNANRLGLYYFHVNEYQWAMNYMSESVCAVTTPAPVIAPCVEREQDWTQEISEKKFPVSAMGATEKGVTAVVCTGYED